MSIIAMMLSVSLLSPREIAQQLAARARARRLAKGLRQQDLAARAGVTLASLRRFERTGLIALESLIKLAVVLEATVEFGALFPEPPFRTLEEVLERPRRQRAPRR